MTVTRFCIFLFILKQHGSISSLIWTDEKAEKLSHLSRSMSEAVADLRAHDLSVDPTSQPLRLSSPWDTAWLLCTRV